MCEIRAPYAGMNSTTKVIELVSLSRNQRVRCRNAASNIAISGKYKNVRTLISHGPGAMRVASMVALTGTTQRVHSAKNELTPSEPVA